MGGKGGTGLSSASVLKEGKTVLDGGKNQGQADRQSKEGT